MKRKFFNLVLAAALVVGGTSTIVSCKDYESEDTQQMRYSIENLNQDFADKVKNLNDQIAALKDALTRIKQCSCDPTEIARLRTDLSNRIDSLKDNYATSDKITDIENRLGELEGKSDDTTWKDSIAKLRQEIKDIAAKIPEKYEYKDKWAHDSIKILNDQIEALKGAVGKGFDDGTLTSHITTLEEKVAALEAKSHDKYDDTELRNKITKVQNDLDRISARDSVEIAALKIRVSDLENDLNSKMDTIWIQHITNLEALVKTMATKDQLNQVADSITQKIIPAMKEELEQKIAAANDAAGKAKDAADKAQAAADKAQQDATAAGQAATKAQTDASQALIDAAAASAKAKSLYDEAVAQIGSVSKKVDDLQESTVDMVKSLITQVIVQSTYSPGVGQLALPLDIQANTLITYYGTSKNAFSFPTANKSYFIDANDVDFYGLDAKDIEVTEGKKADVKDGTILARDGGEGNAGTLYVTVNPSTVDVSGTQFALVNSQGTESKVKLGTAKKSNALLTWGYTRANDNNFYEIPATIKQQNLWDQYVRITFEGAGLRQSVKQLLNDRSQTKADLKSLAKKTVKFVYENMNGRIPRLAVSTPYDVAIGSSKTSLRNVSEMNILAAAVKPVGMGTLDNVDNMKTIPGLERAESVFARFIRNIDLGTIKLNVTHTKIDSLRSIGQVTLTPDFKYEIPIEYTYINPATGLEEVGHTTADISDQMDDLLKAINDTLTTASNNAVKEFNSAVDQFNSIIADLQTEYNLNEQFAGQKENVINKVDNYLTRINNRFTYWFNRAAGAALKPCMLFEASNGVQRLKVGALGTNVKGSTITLIPTTYTYELLAPAYKKFVKVYDKSTGKSLYGKVIEGDQREVEVKGLQSGHKYTVVYETVDYSGQVVARKYQINVQ